MHMYVSVRSFSSNEHVYLNQDQHQKQRGRSIGSPLLHSGPELGSAQCIHVSSQMVSEIIVQGLTT